MEADAEARGVPFEMVVVDEVAWHWGLEIDVGRVVARPSVVAAGDHKVVEGDTCAVIVAEDVGAAGPWYMVVAGPELVGNSQLVVPVEPHDQEEEGELVVEVAGRVVEVVAPAEVDSLDNNDMGPDRAPYTAAVRDVAWLGV